MEEPHMPKRTKTEAKAAESVNNINKCTPRLIVLGVAAHRQSLILPSYEPVKLGRSSREASRLSLSSSCHDINRGY